ncbi:SDR family oxidoreductase [Ensifer adhaerens]|uniref:SDR family oxidoreductase n=1 Tax=Ensifer adhaerens TaxID=106592 RepID=UPI00098F785D|nr:SDR family oxidoreductase [Ensifer adhaerens]
MHVFVTGATGWVGSAVVKDLIEAGHRVSGLARSREKAATLAATGAAVVEGGLGDAAILQRASGQADAVIHTAFGHDFVHGPLDQDFSSFMESAAEDQRVIALLGEVLAGSDRPLLVTSGLAGLPPGATEADVPNPVVPRKSEMAARALAERGIHASTVRLAPSVHGLGDYGFVAIIARLARETGVSAYLDDGANCWSGVYRGDAARVYRLALESGMTESVYHAVADEAVPFRQIAEMVGRHFGLSAEARPRGHFGWFANMAGGSMAVSSARTRALLGWSPAGPDLLSDLDQAAYYAP